MRSQKPESRLFSAVRPLGRTASPQHWLTAVPHFRASRSKSHADHSKLELQGVYLRYSRRRAGKWSADVVYHVDSPAAFWDVMDERTGNNRMLWVCCPQVSELTASVELWMRANEGENVPTSLVLGGPTEIVKTTYRDCTVQFVASFNYLPIPPAELISSVSAVLPEHVKVWSPTDHTGNDPALYCQCLHYWMLRAIDLWCSRDCGKWGTTASQLSHSLYRRRHATGQVIVNKLPHVHALEREALFGGRASVWYVGDVGPEYPADSPDPLRPPPAPDRLDCAQVVKLDVSSMYPSILATERLPVAYSHSDLGISPERLRAGLDVWDAVAEVTLRTESPEYPMRLPGRTVRRLIRDVRTELGKREARGRWVRGVERVIESDGKYESVYLPPEVIYPVGRFTTVLCGPELRAALAEGIVDTVGRVQWYRTAREFASLAEELYQWRQDDARAGDAVGATWCKLLANAFSGKWAQQAGGWVEFDDPIPPTDWGYYLRTSPDTGEVTRCRAIAGLTHRWEPLSGRPKGFPALFAAICSHGRHRMRLIRQRLPVGTVLQQDTDGLTLALRPDHPSCQSLAEHPQGLGRLRVVSTHHRVRFLTPRHYYLDGRWTLAGVASGWTESGVLTVQDDRRAVWHDLARGVPPLLPQVHHRTVSLRSLLVAGGRAVEGWLSPPRVSQASASDFPQS